MSNINDRLIELKNRVLAGYRVELDDIALMKAADTEHLCSLAGEIRDYFSDGSFDLCTIINGKSGRCSENCKFCAQSAHFDTGVDEYDLLESNEILDSAMSNYSKGVNRFSIVTSGRKLNEDEVDRLCKTYESIREVCPINLCSSNGLLEYDDFVRLKNAGVLRYHNNIETSRRFFPHICTTHTFEDKIKAIKAAQRAGLDVCSGGIFGLGESFDDRIDMAFTLRDLGVVSIPINVLNPIKNTPFENNPILTYDELRRSIAFFRFINPKTSIRLAGGRALLGDKGERAIASGIDAMISGDMLTTSGITTEEDIAMIERMGFTAARPHEFPDINDLAVEIKSNLDSSNTDNYKNAIFVTGTGTDIGKTFVSGELLAALRDVGVDAGYYKPMLSGAEYIDGKLIPGDCDYVLKRAGIKDDPNEHTTYVFEEAYSPHLAAEINRVDVDFERIYEDFIKYLDKGELLLVEGCGGIVCPLSIEGDRVIMQDELIRGLSNDVEVILVAESDLGTINGVITAYEYAKQVGIAIKCIIMNRFEPENIKHRDNLKIIEKMTGIKVFTCANHV